MELLQKETPKFILPQLRPPILSHLNPIITVCENYCKGSVTKRASLIWNSD